MKAGAAPVQQSRAPRHPLNLIEQLEGKIGGASIEHWYR